MKKFEKFIIPGGVKHYFFEITVPNVCSCYTESLYFNNVSGYLSKTWT